MRRGSGRIHPTRVERSAQRCCARAEENPARLRTRKSARERTWPRATGRLLALLVVLSSFAAGSAFGNPPGRLAFNWLGPAPLTRVHVRGARRLDPGEVAAATGLAPGALLRRDDISEIAEALLRHPWISGARLLILPSGTLLIDIAERVPEAVVAFASSSGDARVALVDQSGTPFAPATADDIEVLPHLIPSGIVNHGEPDTRLMLALDLAKRLPRHGLPGDLEIFIATSSDPEGLALRLPELPGRVVIGWKDFDARLTRLTALLAADLVQVAAAARIDLRFADQVVLARIIHEGA